MKEKIVILAFVACFLFCLNVNAEEGDFFFAPEFGWSHVFSDNLKEGMFAGAHFGYDTSDNLALELLLFYGDNNAKGTNPDLWYVMGGGGLSYKLHLGNFKPSLYAGATTIAMKFSNTGKNFKGALYTGAGLEYYVNKIVSVGVSYKYLPVFNAPDISMLGFRLGLDL